MHQHPRTPPVTASPANSERTNPSRTNNPRDRDSVDGRQTSEWDTQQLKGLGIGEGGPAPSQSPAPSTAIADSVSKLNQIVQNYYAKAALIILQSRFDLPPAYSKGKTKRVNKWFNVELDETNEFQDDIQPWKTCDTQSNRPPPLLIEIYVDASDLSTKECLVITDDQGKRINALAVLAQYSGGLVRRRRAPQSEIIIERWKIELGETSGKPPPDLGAILPTVYKKSIVLFRSLFTYAKFLPAWKFLKKLSKIRSSGSLKVKYRLVDGSGYVTPPKIDSLSVPFCDHEDRVTGDYSFGMTDSPAGSFSVQVSYRANCDFSIVDNESLLSSEMMLGDDFFKPSLPDTEANVSGQTGTGQEVGSLPVQRRDYTGRPDRGQAYGSLSTFHQVGPATGSSPITTLRNARELGPDSPAESPPTRHLPQRSTQGSRSPLRSDDPSAGNRRASLSIRDFQPFKAPSLSASPAIDQLSTASPRASSRLPPLSALNEARGIPPPAAPTTLAGRKVPPENAIASSASSSPKPAPIARYSSSFSHRRGRLSSGGTSKTDEDQNSSGKGSATSSTAQPGSGIIAETNSGTAGSTGSIHEDDENISAFLKLLDTEKNLLSHGDSSAVDASNRRTAAQLSRFQKMRESNAALSDSMSSSLQLQRSSSSSSRQLSSVPPMVAGTSISTSSSPGKPISPHTPHTPAIPSRLSANSIIEYPTHGPARRHRLSHEVEEPISPSEENTSDDTTMDPTITTASNVNAIDIPTSPRPFIPSYRRSSSVAQRRRPQSGEEIEGDFIGYGATRSASMGASDRQLRDQPVNIDALLGLQAEDSGAGERPDDVDELPGPVRRRPAVNGRTSSLNQAFGSSHAGTTDSGGSGTGSPPSRGASDLRSPHHQQQVHRSRFSRGGIGRGYTPPHSSSNSVGSEKDREAGTNSGNAERRGGSGRYSFSRPAPDHKYEDDEPLLFDMSELGGKRSFEDGRGGGEIGGSKRGSRRGNSGAAYNAWS